MAKLDERRLDGVLNLARSGNCRGLYAERRGDEIALRYRAAYGRSCSIARSSRP